MDNQPMRKLDTEACANYDISENQIILQIENAQIICNKEELSANSDYFKVMFNGSFSESKKKLIKLEGVPFDQFKTILELLNYPFENIGQVKDQLLILKLCDLLQFTAIKEQLISRLENSLHVESCIDVWITAEDLSIKSLESKAKIFSLANFEEVKESNQIRLLDFNRLYVYLADTSLNCINEYSVFEVCWNWWTWYQEEHDMFLSNDKAFKCFLSCLNFHHLTLEELALIINLLNLDANSKIGKILDYIIKMKKEDILNEECINSDVELELLNMATKMYNSKPRNNSIMCAIIKNYSDTGNCSKTNFRSTANNAVKQELFLAYFDEWKNDFEILENVTEVIPKDLCGFKLVGYKQDTILIVGGEYGIGTGRWNKTLRIYNIITKKWRSINVPFVRRHFSYVLGGNYLYIIGGVGNFRLQMTDMYLFDIENEIWHGPFDIPQIDSTVKFVYCNDRLILFDIWNFKMYFLNESTWDPIPVDNPQMLCEPNLYLLFAQNNNIYIKGSSCVKIVLEPTRAKVVDCKQISKMECDIADSGCIIGSSIYEILEPLFGNHLVIQKFCMKSNCSSTLFKSESIDIVENIFTMTTYNFQLKNVSYVNDFWQ